MTPANPGRRALATGLVAAAATAALPGVRARAPAPMPRDPRFGIAIVGLGSYARICIERLRQSRQARLAAIITGSPTAAGEFADGLGLHDLPILGYADTARLAADPGIDAVHVCLPVGLHASFARTALAAGKHVLCEKPLATDPDEAASLVAEARRAGRQLMPAYRAWFSVAVKDVLQRVRERRHGGLVSVDAHKGFAMNQPAGHWRFDPALAGGGCLTDIGIYSVQLQRWLAGGLPRRVTAFARHEDPARFGGLETDVHWLAEFANGVLATGSASWRYRLQNRLQLGFEQASLLVDPATPALGERMQVALDAPARIEAPVLPLLDQIPAMYDAFAAACRGQAPLPVSPDEGVADLRMMQAIRDAAASGRSVTL